MNKERGNEELNILEQSLGLAMIDALRSGFLGTMEDENDDLTDEFMAALDVAFRQSLLPFIGLAREIDRPLLGARLSPDDFYEHAEGCDQCKKVCECAVFAHVENQFGSQIILRELRFVDRKPQHDLIIIHWGLPESVQVCIPKIP